MVLSTTIKLILSLSKNPLVDDQGAKQDYSKAREWFEEAAKQEDEEAQYSLGCMYKFGHGVKQDYSKARDWIEKAAKQGHPVAQCDLPTPVPTVGSALQLVLVHVSKNNGEVDSDGGDGDSHRGDRCARGTANGRSQFHCPEAKGIESLARSK